MGNWRWSSPSHSQWPRVYRNTFLFNQHVQKIILSALDMTGFFQKLGVGGVRNRDSSGTQTIPAVVRLCWLASFREWLWGRLGGWRLGRRGGSMDGGKWGKVVGLCLSKSDSRVPFSIFLLECTQTPWTWSATDAGIVWPGRHASFCCSPLPASRVISRGRDVTGLRAADSREVRYVSESRTDCLLQQSNSTVTY